MEAYRSVSVGYMGLNFVLGDLRGVWVYGGFWRKTGTAGVKRV